MQHVFIIGSKGIPAKYGGFETFVDKLTANRKSRDISYHVACMSDNEDEFVYNNSHCFNIKVPPIGAARAVLYDLKAFEYSLNYIEKHNIKHPIVYVLACRIGPFVSTLKRRLERLGGRMYVNPDGHEWKRSKWNCIIKRYWKISEQLMAKYADLMVCDSRNIEKYIRREYRRYKPKTTYIAYGAEIKKSVFGDDDDDDEILKQWYFVKRVQPREYYVIVGRFVPENNYETMIREFMKSKTQKNLVIITDPDNSGLVHSLQRNTQFWRDKRIKFVGTVYDQELIKKIRENAFAYIHGHEVGGTNPSLLESLASTKVNILLNVGFNREVAKDGAVYWSKEEGSLSSVIDKVDHYDAAEIEALHAKAKKRIEERFNWDYIVDKYERIFNVR